MSLYNPYTKRQVCRDIRHDPLGFLKWLNQTAYWTDAYNDILAELLVEGLGFDVRAALREGEVIEKYAQEPLYAMDRHYSTLAPTDPIRDLTQQMTNNYFHVFLLHLVVITLPLNQYPWLEHILPDSDNPTYTTSGGRRRVSYRAMFFIRTHHNEIVDGPTPRFLQRGLKPATLTIYHPQPGDTVNDAMVIKPYDFQPGSNHLVPGLISDDDLRGPNVIETLYLHTLHS